MFNYELLTESVCDKYPLIEEFVFSLNGFIDSIDEGIELEDNIDCLIESVYELLPESVMYSDIEKDLLYEAVMYVLENRHSDRNKTKAEKLTKELNRKLQSTAARGGVQKLSDADRKNIRQMTNNIDSATNEYLKKKYNEYIYPSSESDALYTIDKKFSDKDKKLFKNAERAVKTGFDVSDLYLNDKYNNDELKRKYTYMGNLGRGGSKSIEARQKAIIRRNQGIDSISVNNAKKELENLKNTRAENKSAREEKENAIQAAINANKQKKKEELKNQLTYAERQAKLKPEHKGKIGPHIQSATFTRPQQPEVAEHKGKIGPHIQSATFTRPQQTDSDNNTRYTVGQKAGNWIKSNPGKSAAIAAGLAAATAGGVYAAKKIADKKKAAKKARNEKDIKENYEYEEYPLLIEGIVANLTEEELFSENCEELVHSVADYMIENADLY